MVPQEHLLRKAMAHALWWPSQGAGQSRGRGWAGSASPRLVATGWLVSVGGPGGGVPQQEGEQDPHHASHPSQGGDGEAEKPLLFALRHAGGDPLEGSRFPAKSRYFGERYSAAVAVPSQPGVRSGWGTAVSPARPEPSGAKLGAAKALTEARGWA